MNNFRFAIAIVLLVSIIPLFFFVEDIKDDKGGLLHRTTFEELVTQMCNAGWGDAFGVTGECLKYQIIYYSPWIVGFFGLIFLAKAGPYKGYHGAGGTGSHNRRRSIRPKTKKRLKIIIPIIGVVAIGAFLYANYEITVGDQKIDEIIPPEAFEEALEDFGKGFPVKIQERPPGPDYSVEGLMEKYQSPLGIKLAVDRGELEYDKIPKSLQKEVDNAPMPRDGGVP